MAELSRDEVVGVRLGLAGAKVKVIEVVWNGLIEGRQLGVD
jgi:hypothetical protein